MSTITKITLDEVIDGIEEVLLEVDPTVRHTDCFYKTDKGEGVCLVGCLLQDLDLLAAFPLDLNYARVGSIIYGDTGSTPANDWWGAHFDTQAKNFLNLVQDNADRGQSWVTAYDLALSDFNLDVV